jgi:hypothetical protein
MNGPFDNLYLNGDIKEIRIPYYLFNDLEKYMKDQFYLESKFILYLRQKFERLHSELKDREYILENIEDIKSFQFYQAQYYYNKIKKEIKRVHKEIWKYESLKKFLNNSFFYCEYIQDYYYNKFFKFIDDIFDKWYYGKFNNKNEEIILECKNITFL